MKKIGYIILSCSLFLGNLSAIENELFDLVIRAKRLVEISEVQNKINDPEIRGRYLSCLNSLIKDPSIDKSKIADVLDKNILDLIEENVMWTELRAGNLEQMKINLIKSNIKKAILNEDFSNYVAKSSDDAEKNSTSKLMRGLNAVKILAELAFKDAHKEFMANLSPQRHEEIKYNAIKEAAFVIFTVLKNFR